MASYEPLSPKPGGSGGHFWSVWADWGLVAKVGLGFVAAIALYASVEFYFEDDNQKGSFAVAQTTLSQTPLDQPVTQRHSRLLKQGKSYSWRSILWVRNGSSLQPKIWQALVVHEGNSFRCVSSEIAEYNQDKAYSLELYDDVSRGPLPTR